MMYALCSSLLQPITPPRSSPQMHCWLVLLYVNQTGHKIPWPWLNDDDRWSSLDKGCSFEILNWTAVTDITRNEKLSITNFFLILIKLISGIDVTWKWSFTFIKSAISVLGTNNYWIIFNFLWSCISACIFLVSF